MDIFESLEGLNVSEECFDDILSIIDEYTNASRMVDRLYGDKYEKLEPHVQDKISKAWDAADDMKDSRNPKAKNEPDAHNSFSVIYTSKNEPDYNTDKGLKLRYEPDESSAHFLNANDSAKVATSQSIQRHYNKEANKLLNAYKKSKQGKKGSFKKLSEDIENYKREAYDKTAQKALEMANKNRRYGEKMTETPNYHNNYNLHIVDHKNLDSIADILQKAGKEGTPSTAYKYKKGMERNSNKEHGKRIYTDDDAHLTPEGAYDSSDARSFNLNLKQAQQKTEDYKTRKSIAKHLRKLKKKGLSESSFNEVHSQVEQILEDIVSQAYKNYKSTKGDLSNSLKKRNAARILRKAVDTMYDNQQRAKEHPTKNELGEKKTDARRMYKGNKGGQEAIENTIEKRRYKKLGIKDRGDDPRGGKQYPKQGDEFMDTIARKAPGVSFTGAEWHDGEYYNDPDD